MTSIQWFESLDVAIKTGLVAGIFSIIVLFIKDVVIHLWKWNREDKFKSTKIFRNYAEPISLASSSLFWRLRELLLEEGRGAFLKDSDKSTKFEKYKYESTLFRIASLIAWLRAYRRELVLFSLNGSKILSSFSNALNEFESALADGAHVEVQRVRSVSSLWDLNIPTEMIKISTIGVEVENKLKKILKKYGAELAVELTKEQKIYLCKEISDVICARIGENSVSEHIINETAERAARSLSIREAWLYRDLQSGIGDLMIRKIERGSRQFEIVGFREFEGYFFSQDEEENRWIGRLSKIIDKLDISGADRFDARVEMMERMLLSTISLLKALHDIDPRRGLVDNDVLCIGKNLHADQSWRKTAKC